MAFTRQHGRISAGGLGTSKGGKILTITGLKELDDKLLAVPPKLGKSLGRRAVGRAMTIIANGIKSEVRPHIISHRVTKKGKAIVKTRQLSSIKKSIGKRFRLNRKKYRVEAKVGIGVGKKRGRYAPHAHLISLGTKDRKRKSGGRTGRIRGDNFVARGFAKTRSAADEAMREMVHIGIEEHFAAK